MRNYDRDLRGGRNATSVLVALSDEQHQARKVHTLDDQFKAVKRNVDDIQRKVIAAENNPVRYDMLCKLLDRQVAILQSLATDISERGYHRSNSLPISRVFKGRRKTAPVIHLPIERK